MPEEIAVVGCEDTESHSFTGPALTTVRRPHHKVGRRAAANLLSQMQGDRVDHRFIQPTEIVIRESCGCSPRASSSDRDTEKHDLAALLEENRERIIGDMAQALESIGLGALGWLERLVDAFGHDVERAGESHFSQALEELLSQDVPVGGDDAWAWQNAVAVLRQWVMRLVTDDHPRAARTEELWRQARLVVGGVARRAEAHRTRMVETASRISQALIGTIDLCDVVAVLAERLPALRVRGLWLALYEDRKVPVQSTLTLSYDNAEARLETSSAPFASRKLVPDGTLPSDRQLTLALQPLHFKQEQLGFVIFRRNAGGRVTELSVVQDRVWDLRFARQTAALKSVSQ